MDFSYSIVLLGAEPACASFFLRAIAQAAALRDLFSHPIQADQTAEGLPLHRLLLCDRVAAADPQGAADLIVTVGEAAARVCLPYGQSDSSYLLCAEHHREAAALMQIQAQLEACGRRGRVLPPYGDLAAAPFLLGGALYALRASGLFEVEELAQAVSHLCPEAAAAHLEALERGLSTTPLHICHAEQMPQQR